MLDNIVILWLSWKAIISIIWFIVLFIILVLEKVEKTVIAILIAGILVFLQVYTVPGSDNSSQYEAAIYIYKNLDIFAFITWMMIIAGITKDTWFFNFLAMWIVRKVKWHPILLFLTLSYLSFFMTVFISNIPTIIILTPIVLLITKSLDLPPLPYIIGIITFANLWGAVTPISDPTTYYQATTLWFSFWQVFSNTGFIMFTVSIISAIYLYIVFRKSFKVSYNKDFVQKLNPISYLEDKRWMIISLVVMSLVIFFVVFKEFIYNWTGIKFDNGWIAIFGAFLLILLLKRDVHHVLRSKVDYATLFFFAWLFVVVGALEHNWVIHQLADLLIHITEWSHTGLLAMITMWSALLSVFVDNVPYNIAMVATLEQFLNSWAITGAAWYALAWWLNSCTSIGWAGSPIWAACNVIALWQAEKSGVVIAFAKYLLLMVPLVLINSFTAFSILYFRYLV